MRSSTRFLLSSQPVQSADRMDANLAFHSDVFIALAVLLCAFLFVLGLGFFARCAWVRRSLTAASYDGPLPLPLLRIPRKGIKKKTLRALPTLSFVSSDAAAAAAAAPGGVELVDCAICLAEFVDGDRVRVLPQCGHGFHAACVDTWLGSNASCPSCRRVLVVPAPPRRCQKCGRDSSEAAASAKPTESGGGGGASTSKTAHR
ncbi:RING-H2 finger protein ATL8-like [Curcuma longa]|uniref:RING-H2 finger protein ATL8-like n=1 Tax=Curcuma longa TaxID=136217 RepID=UPI003D9F9F7D